MSASLARLIVPISQKRADDQSAGCTDSSLVLLQPEQSVAWGLFSFILSPASDCSYALLDEGHLFSACRPMTSAHGPARCTHLQRRRPDQADDCCARRRRPPNKCCHRPQMTSILFPSFIVSLSHLSPFICAVILPSPSPPATTAPATTFTAATTPTASFPRSPHSFPPHTRPASRHRLRTRRHTRTSRRLCPHLPPCLRLAVACPTAAW